MTATITRLPVAAVQAAPDEADQTASFTRFMADAFIAEGYRRACEEFGIPYFPQSSPARVLSLVAPGPARLVASRKPCTLCGGHGQVVEGHDCPRCGGSGNEP